MFMLMLTVDDLDCDVRITGACLVLGNKPLRAYHCKTRSESSTFRRKSLSSAFSWKSISGFYFSAAQIFLWRTSLIWFLGWFRQGIASTQRQEKYHNKETGRQRENVKCTKRQVKYDIPLANTKIYKMDHLFRTFEKIWQGQYLTWNFDLTAPFGCAFDHMLLRRLQALDVGVRVDVKHRPVKRQTCSHKIHPPFNVFAHHIRPCVHC